jgi:hypothetical protein
MKKSELKQLVKEELTKILSENNSISNIELIIARPGGEIYKLIVYGEEGTKKEIFRGRNSIENFEAKYGPLKQYDYEITDFDVS